MLCNFEMSQNNNLFLLDPVKHHESLDSSVHIVFLKPQYHHHCKDSSQTYIIMLWTPAISYLDIYTQESFLTEQ